MSRLSRNTATLLAQGAFEVAPGHYPLIVQLHACWLLGLWVIGWGHPLSQPWLMIFWHCRFYTISISE